MRIEPVHHVPLRPEYKSPYSAAFAVEDARLVFFSGCTTVPVYHQHPHDYVEERVWLAKDLRQQTERAFEQIKMILAVEGADFGNIVKLTIYMTDISGQDIVNEVSARYLNMKNPPARGVIMQVAALAHPGLLVEIEGIFAVAKRTPKPRKRRARPARRRR